MIHYIRMWCSVMSSSKTNCVHKCVCIYIYIYIYICTCVYAHVLYHDVAEYTMMYRNVSRSLGCAHYRQCCCGPTRGQKCTPYLALSHTDILTAVYLLSYACLYMLFCCAGSIQILVCEQRYRMMFRQPSNGRTKRPSHSPHQTSRSQLQHDSRSHVKLYAFQYLPWYGYGNRCISLYLCVYIYT